MKDLTAWEKVAANAIYFAVVAIIWAVLIGACMVNTP